MKKTERESLKRRLLRRLTPNFPTGCWEFSGHRNKGGYGVFRFRRQMGLAHRVSFMVFRRDPGKLDVLHECDNPACFNPDHLFLGTQAENNKDAARKGRTQCGEKRANAKLTEKKVLEIHSLLAAGVPQITISRKYGVSPITIVRIRKGTGWRHVKPKTEQAS